MTDTAIQPRRGVPNALAILAFVLAVAALFFPRPPAPTGGTSGVDTALDQIRDTRTLRVGFEGYPPYAVQDPRDSSMSGYSVEMAAYIAKEAAWNIRWIKTSPDTKIPDLKARKFDVMVEPIFRTIPRAKEVTFTRAYAYFGYASAIVREGDSRFPKFANLNHSDIKIVVRQGYTDQAYAETHLPEAQVRSMKVDDINMIFLEVMAGNADAALADTSQVRAFHKEHEDSVDMLFVDPPTASVPAGFMIRQGDFGFANFLDSCIDFMEASGFLKALDTKYQVTAPRN